MKPKNLFFAAFAMLALFCLGATLPEFYVKLSSGTSGKIAKFNSSLALVDATVGTDYQAPFTTGLGITNVNNVLSNNIVAGANVTITAASNGQLSIAAAGSSGVADGDKGDITVSSSGSVWTIDNGVVSLAKMANMATDSIIGRATASTGAPEVLTALPWADTGDVTRSADSTSTTIAASAVTTTKIADANVTLAKMANIATDSILGRATAATGVPEVLTALPWAFTGDVTSAADANALTIANNAVTLAKMADIATASVLGRNTASTGDPEVLTTLPNGVQDNITRLGSVTVAAFGGSVTGTTATAGDNDTSLATTAFVSTAAGATQTGTHASPSTTNPLSPTWSGPLHTVWYGATGTVNLPAVASYTGKAILIYNTGAFTVTIDPNGSEVVVRDGTVQTGGVNFTLSSGAGNYVALFCDGARWITLGYKGSLSLGS